MFGGNSDKLERELGAYGSTEVQDCGLYATLC